jgi:hypothetical protein
MLFICSFSVIAVQEVVDAASLKQVQFILHLSFWLVFLLAARSKEQGLFLISKFQ